MKKMLVSEFKADCVATLNRVAREGEAVVVTKRGTPLVRIEPVRDRSGVKREAGDSSVSAQIHGDIIQLDTSDAWEALRE
ncbi:MAG: type II toxin-antitoxin system Phd/YefM family antitoxin [Opitutales bacterium]